ncbi:MAG: Coenzyme F420 hydrogenase/dehydrogenase, beta subunit C-terminal domain [Lachnospiraceae bacterium]|nr:Coenzyme F420 hydrogenase/dehydrogenase, beta subunit C-terminal domain [Lachnospiraceae bacterium]
MLTITDKRFCTGCGACINACPKKIISLQEDEEGFWYPKIDESKCVDCHLCEKVCPFKKERQKDINEDYPRFYAGQLKCKDDLNEVSSGGAFWAVAQYVLSIGGVVFGAIQENVDNIYHVRTTNIDEAQRMRRSKYFQSDTNYTFCQAKEDLQNNKIVLYSGTGCQIAGLLSFLNKEYDNLITCEVVCHGVPSRKVWKKYREEKEHIENKRITGLVFRDKSKGWSNNQYKITFDDCSIEYEKSTQQLFHAGYLQGLFYRPSCGCCRFASLPRVADITLADYWQYKGRFRTQDNDLGVSLISINTSKGTKLLNDVSDYLDYETTENQLALSSCRHLDNHPTENPKRKLFFEVFFVEGYYKAANNYIVVNNGDSLLHKIGRKVNKVLRRIVNGKSK